MADREVERIAVSVARYDPDSVSVALVENHYDQMFAGAGAEPDINKNHHVCIVYYAINFDFAALRNDSRT